MATASTTSPADFALRRVTLLERKLLKTLMFSLRMEQFSEKKTAKSEGFQNIRFFRARKARRSTNTQGPQNLTEGVQNLRKSDVSVGGLDCYLNQRGDDFEITDVVTATDILDTLNTYTKTLGEDAALDYDSVITASVMGDATTNGKAKALGLGAAQVTLFNSNNTYGISGAPYFERMAGIVNTGISAADFASLSALTVANSKFTRLEHLRALTQMKANDIRPKDGMVFPVLIPPQVMFDIRQDTTLVAAMTERDNAKLYKWEEFELDGGAFIQHTNPWTESNYGIFNTAGSILTTLYIGDDPFGTVMIDNKKAGGDPASPKMTILDQPDKSDRYNQIVAGSWKAFYGSILKVTSDPSDVPHVVALRMKSSFV